jgi:hypothetical protein
VREQGAQRLEDEITVFTISFGDAPGMPQIPIRLTLPSAVVEKGKALLDDVIASIPTPTGRKDAYDVWE